jgi:4-alpha-glucanotransferase
MNLHFHIHFYTQYGQQLLVCGNLPELGAWDPAQALSLHYMGDGRWEVPLDLAENTKGELAYKYVIDHGHGAYEWEPGDNRTTDLNAKRFNFVLLRDQWRSKYDEQQALYSSAFTDVLMRRPAFNQALATPKSGSVHRLQLRAPRVDPHCVMAVVGSHEALGAWDESRAVIMDDAEYPLWRADVALTGPSAMVDYKYGIYDPQAKQFVTWEDGGNRSLSYLASRRRKQLTVLTEEAFRYPVGNWKGTGMAIPVFSLRSQQSMGVGEFLDLKATVDWAKQTGLKLIQILPINDTVATHTWIDSYPYSAISVFALHPMFCHPDHIAELQDPETLLELRSEGKRLNDLEEVDYEGVMALKTRWFKLLFDQEREAFLGNEDAQAFFVRNQAWLKPYAAYSTLRDRYQEPNFRQWPTHSTFDQAEIDAFVSADASHHDDVAIHYFIQYHLHRQMLEAATYAREHGVVLKGDIPIGIYRHSVDAWVAPELYNMDGQAGAPPDDFAVAGQNWRFPTYNWEEMAKDGYQWWRRRMQKMAVYFDAYRIDHILGFFRIWQIPATQVQGILGQFNPSLPYNTHELSARDLWFDKDRLTEPYIRSHMLDGLFAEHRDSVVQEFLDEPNPGMYAFKPWFKTQRQIEAYIDDKMTHFPESQAYFERVRPGLYSLISEVILLPNHQGEEEAYDPRVAMHFTRSYQELDGWVKTQLDALYTEYFYFRHEDFWRSQGLAKLPPVKEATNMLVCGEDLGMVPDCVPPVMKELGILSLEIQRMPKSNKIEFAHPGDAPYLSVVSTSTHDMPTIRGWWEQDPATTQRFYQHGLGHGGGAPYFCEDWIARDIIAQHLHSPAMWAVLPLQDLLAMDAGLRREDPHAEQINVPANPEHYWRYRMHVTLEELIDAEGYNAYLHGMITASGRDQGH